MTFLAGLDQFVKETDFSTISDDRKKVLQQLIDYVNEKREKGELPKLIFVCSHNSRRSHLAQIWAHVAANKYGIPIGSWSGGVEVTNMDWRIVRELRNEGFIVDSNDSENPKYRVFFSENEAPVICFSKMYDDRSNPRAGFAAVMVCTSAEQNCPFVAGAEKRFSVTYNDPKEFDETEEEEDAYRERSLQVATEMFYVFSKIH